MLKHSQETQAERDLQKTAEDYREVAAAAITVIRWLHNPSAYDAYDIYTAIRTVTLAEAGV